MEKKIVKILSEELNIDEDKIRSDSSLTLDLLVDSLDFLTIIFRLEQEFKVKINRDNLFPDNSDINKFTVQDIVSHLNKLGV